MNYRRLRIIMGEERHATARHAATLHRALNAYDDKNPHRVFPRGVAHHTAQYPSTCDDCGETFWSRDEYANHLGCKGAPPKQTAGFS